MTRLSPQSLTFRHMGRDISISTHVSNLQLKMTQTNPKQELDVGTTALVNITLSYPLSGFNSTDDLFVELSVEDVTCNIYGFFLRIGIIYIVY